MKARLMALLLALALGASVAAGCGGDGNGGDSGSSGGAYGGDKSKTDTGAAATTATETTDTGASTGGGKGTELKIAADPNGALKFDKDTLKAPAGTVTIVMDNPSTLPHAVEIEGGGTEAKGETVSTGGKSTATAPDLKAGKYVFYCPVAGHREAGMEGTLTVTAGD